MRFILAFLLIVGLGVPYAAAQDTIPMTSEFEAVINELPPVEPLDENAPEQPTSAEGDDIVPFLDEKAPMENMNTVVLRALDKITGRTQTFSVAIGETIKFGAIYVMPRGCRKNPPIETPESASFLQIWEIHPDNGPQWIFSNWMFASSPALSAMNHAVYDIWVVDCKNSDSKISSEIIEEIIDNEEAAE